MVDKPALRARLRAIRDVFVSTSPPFIPVPEELLGRFTPGLTVASYSAVGSEATPDALAEAATRCGCRLALPHIVDRDQPIRFLAWDLARPLVTGPYRLWQPEADAPEVSPDMILTPLLGFDVSLNRIGQGAGHYDRAFAQFPEAIRIGVAWDVQRVASLPLDPWDLPLHAVVTEAGWHTAGEPA